MYSKHLSKALAGKVDEARALDPFDLTEELALLRVMALDTAQLYDVIRSVENDKLGNPIPDSDRLTMAVEAGKVCRDALGEVFDAVKRMTEVESNRKDMVTSTSLTTVLARVVTAVHDVLGDERETEVMAIAEAIRKIKLPSQNSGTDLTPDLDALDMDASVPIEEE